ncbi:hypothetical protein ZWY2020_020178 [Hordeum vulgare]|nr:hypothetical protein ZWY2020_020178 [Hordeum vulgare]
MQPPSCRPRPSPTNTTHNKIAATISRGRHPDIPCRRATTPEVPDDLPNAIKPSAAGGRCRGDGRELQPEAESPGAATATWGRESYGSLLISCRLEYLQELWPNAQ